MSISDYLRKPMNTWVAHEGRILEERESGRDICQLACYASAAADGSAVLGSQSQRRNLHLNIV